jgi:hypothetical protein
MVLSGIVLLLALGMAGLALLNFSTGSVPAISSLILQTQSQILDKDQLEHTRQIIEQRLAPDLAGSQSLKGKSTWTK